MTEIKVNENGQAFFDFDALEKLTSPQFVSYVIEGMSDMRKVQKMSFSNLNYNVRVTVFDGYNFKMFIFNKRFAEMLTTEFNHLEFELAKDLLEGVI